MRVLVLADTHVRAGSARRLPAAVYAAAAGANAILHAGDIVSASLLEELATLAPVHAVLGNNDLEQALAHLPESLVLELEGVRVAMIHDSGPAKGREQRLHRRFPDAAVVVFGHSHVPWNAEGVDGQLLFNPGSPTQRRSQPHHTFGLLDLAGGRVTRHEIVVVPAAVAPPQASRRMQR